MKPEHAERQFMEKLDEAGLPRFASVFHDTELNQLEFTWDHGLTIYLDLSCDDVSPIVKEEVVAILGLPLESEYEEPLHITVPASARDPRTEVSIPGVVIHRVPPLHPDDVIVHDGVRVTTPSRTLIDLAEVMGRDELRASFARAREIGLLDPAALRAARARVEWRPSLAMLDEVIAEFCD